MKNCMMTCLMNKTWVSRLGDFYLSIIHFLERFLSPFMLLGIRLWMAKIFWYSGLNKISGWESTVFLFEHEYKIPVIPAEIAAYLATSFELACPVLLAIGFASRLSTLPMLIMTAIIQLTYLDLIDHYYWGMLLGTILLCGPGTLSIDHWLRHKFMHRTNHA